MRGFRSASMLLALGLCALSLPALAAPVPAGPPAGPTTGPAPGTGNGGPSTFLVTGRAEYQDKAWDVGGWTGEATPQPVRRADVTVIDAVTGKVLGRGQTDQDGEYAVASTSSGLRDVQVRIEASTRHAKLVGSPFARLRITTPANAVWSVSTPTASQHDTTAPLDLGTITALPVPIAGGNSGNPFNVFDLTVAAFEWLADSSLSVPQRGRATVVWPSLLGSYAWKRKAWIATDDGDDDAVILHELGHIVHNVYSDSDNPGGVHYFGDSDQDPRLSLGEGWATAFAAAVLGDLGRPPVYLDAQGDESTGGVQLVLHLETAFPYASTTHGAADEVAVACVLYDLLDGSVAPDDTPALDDDAFDETLEVAGGTSRQALWDVFTGPMRRARRLTANHVWDGWLKRHADDDHFDELLATHAAWGLLFWMDAAEPDNDPGAAVLLPAAPDADWSEVRTLYFTQDPALGSGTGDRDRFALELTAGQVLTLETRYPGGAWDARTQVDPALSLFGPDGHKVAFDDDSGPGRNARILGFPVPVSGTWTAVVSSRNRTSRYGCYEIRATLEQD